jgi:hypothetical protein
MAGGRRFDAMTDVRDGDDADIADPSVQWLEQLGAFYDAPAVRTLLGGEGEPVNLEAVRESKGLMVLTTGAGQVIYPAFQFRDRLLAPGLDRVLVELPESLVSRWSLASWLISAESDLEGVRPIDVLFDQGPAGVDAVVHAARTWAAQLEG